MRASYSASQILKIKWRVANPDEGNPLTYDVDLLVDGKSYPLARELRTDWYQFRLKEALVAHNVKQVSNRTKFGLRVVAHSVDGVIRSEKHSETFVLVP
ncbi:MAG: hypothetical protein IT289_12955 [Oligoflexia bacterium]|nr:hypothetical protein [Oligoflexia bacterium]